MNNKIKGCFMLLLTALIWGSSFVAQKSGMNYVEPFTFICSRSFIGAIVLIPVIHFLDKLKKTSPNGKNAKLDVKTLFLGGLSCGLVLFAAMAFQQSGILYTEAGKAGFITAMYIILVPIFGIFIGKKIRPIIIGCICIAAYGLYLLCMPSGNGFGGINKGDFLVLIASAFYAIHILVIDYFAPKTDGVRMSCIQFFTTGIVAGIAMLIFETPSIGEIVACAVPILYAGALSSGAGFTLQIVAQKYVDPLISSLILSLESVFSVIAGMVLLGEQLAMREGLGCIIMFVAIILAQLPGKNKTIHENIENK